MPSVRVWFFFLAALLPAAPGIAAAPGIHGVVLDSSRAAVAGAEVVLATGERAVIAVARTDARGAFQLDPPTPGRYLLIVTAPGFQQVRRAIDVANGSTAPIEIVLPVGPLVEDVTVTAAPGQVQDIRTAGQPVNVIGAEELQSRVRTVVAEAVEGETGVQLQRTSPTMAGVFVRGLTGNKVNVFVDGIRYSNGAQRGGVNTFLDLIEPGMLESVEVLRGPSSAQYGSDALGGSVQFLTKLPVLASPGQRDRWGGSATLSGGTGHRDAGGEGFASYSGDWFALTMSGAGRTAGRIRPGDGVDSHAAVTRFFGLPSTAVMPERLPDTGFRQAGGSVRAHWAASPRTRVVAGYARTWQDGGRRYDQLLGGDGNLIADLRGLSLDFASARVERLGGRVFDYMSLTYSLNSQREERVNQGGNGNPAASIGHEPERTTAHGIHGALTKQLGSRASATIGGDVYLERLSSDAFNEDPVTGAVTERRPRIPDGATFRHGGAFVQMSADAVPDRVRLQGAFRVGGAAYRAKASDSPLVNGRPLWPDDSLAVASPTYRAGLVVTPDASWVFSATVSRGFRAPHMTDLGTLGLTGSGFEVAAPDVAGLDATVGSTADASARTTGIAVQQVAPETSLQYEGSAGYRRVRWRADVTWFVNTIDGNIQKQSLILPAGSVGVRLGGEPIVSQTAAGAVFVAASTSPVLVRANFDRARVWGVEHSGTFTLAAPLTLQTVFTYLHARDTATGLPPNIEGGTPAPEAYVLARWKQPGSHWSVEPYLRAAWRQSNLSSLDLSDRRTGAARSRSNIRAFFQNGARARGWIGPGPDGAFGTPDDVLLATGETLAQIQDRVLGPGVSSAPLYTSVPGYVALGARAVFTVGAHEVSVHAENPTDANYRGISWGVDAPGRGVSARYRVSF